MPSLVPLLADLSSNLLAARTQMGFTLGFHIVLACFGVASNTVLVVEQMDIAASHPRDRVDRPCRALF